MKMPIKPSRSYLKHVSLQSNPKTFNPGAGHEIAWSKSLPFANNPRGIISHRVANVTSYIFPDRRHHNIGYLCGNSCNVEWDDTAKIILSDPGDRLLCARCEAIAERLGLPGADTLAGRHVHRGMIYAKQTCCLETP